MQMIMKSEIDIPAYHQQQFYLHHAPWGTYPLSGKIHVPQSLYSVDEACQDQSKETLQAE
jgi:hypothetical protein